MARIAIDDCPTGPGEPNDAHASRPHAIVDVMGAGRTAAPDRRNDLARLQEA
jgi:hypothetical protein